MAKQKKPDKPIKNLIIIMLVVGIAIIAFNKQISTFLTNSSQPKENVKINKTVAEEAYESGDVFLNSPLVKRQIDPNLKLYKENNFFSEKVSAELQSSPESELVGMKCMPEQVFFDRYGMDYSTRPLGSSNYYGVNLKDKKILEVISDLRKLMPENYALSQLLACQTEDGGYILKYNEIQKDSIGNGFNTDTKPVAFFAKRTQDGEIQELAYIPLPVATYCHKPIQLTKSGQFYFLCEEYFSFRTSDPAGKIMPSSSTVYKIDLNKLQYEKIGGCLYISGTGTSHCD